MRLKILGEERNGTAGFTDGTRLQRDARSSFLVYIFDVVWGEK